MSVVTCTCDPSLIRASASPWTCPHGNTWRLGVASDPYCWTPATRGQDMETEATEAVEVWIKAGCLVCEFTDYSPEQPGPRDQVVGQSAAVRDGRCPNDDSVLLRMDGLIVADDVIAVARLLVKADREKREGQRSLIAARADLGRVQQLIDRRTTELGIRP